MRHAENIRRLVPEARLIADVASERARQAAAEVEILQMQANSFPVSPLRDKG
jgi:hypothetical protein